ADAHNVDTNAREQHPHAERWNADRLHHIARWHCHRRLDVDRNLHADAGRHSHINTARGHANRHRSSHHYCQGGRLVDTDARHDRRIALARTIRLAADRRR
ncbi:MAG TPA: hypothetical protein VKJ07_18745, partial [Mycobacteriales bacterium]|nr:hypothetical protein [Mycobacteriales bacterium]